jgi:exodeoxyribonuclease-1
MSLVFYDTETTGVDTHFDQILQFAAIKTDAFFKEVDRFETRCRLLPHVVPAPNAMIVNGVRASQLIDVSNPTHYEMVRKIVTKLEAWSPAIFAGWNTIRFDEEMIRQALYKTLHRPYLTNTKGNSRTDVMRMVQACSIYSSDTLKIPTEIGGKPVFKLIRVATENGFRLKRAHEALEDVRATIFLAKMVSENAPNIWSAFMRFSKKASVAAFLNEEKLFCFTEFYQGSLKTFVVTALRRRENSPEWIVFDLAIAPESLAFLSDEELVLKCQWPQSPLHVLKSNAAPMIFSIHEAPANLPVLAMRQSELERRAEYLKSNAEFVEHLLTAHESNQKEFPAAQHIEAQIYDGFPCDSDHELMDEFHAAEWPKRAEIVKRFADKRLKKLGHRLLHIERPDLLDTSTRKAHDLEASKQVVGQCQHPGGLTLIDAIKQTNELLKDENHPHFDLLSEHREFLRTRLNAAESHLNAP